MSQKSFADDIKRYCGLAGADQLLTEHTCKPGVALPVLSEFLRVAALEQSNDFDTALVQLPQKMIQIHLRHGSCLLPAWHPRSRSPGWNWVDAGYSVFSIR